MNSTEKETSIKSKMSDILLDISWAKISTKYFGKSRSWLSQKMNGKDGNGATTEFNDEERETLKHALHDLAKRMQQCADKL